MKILIKMFLGNNYSDGTMNYGNGNCIVHFLLDRQESKVQVEFTRCNWPVKFHHITLRDDDTGGREANQNKFNDNGGLTW